MAGLAKRAGDVVVDEEGRVPPVGDDDLAGFTDRDIWVIQERINDTPRKSLNYDTPNEAMAEYLKEVVH